MHAYAVTHASFWWHTTSLTSCSKQREPVFSAGKCCCDVCHMQCFDVISQDWRSSNSNMSVPSYFFVLLIGLMGNNLEHQSWSFQWHSWAQSEDRWWPKVTNLNLLAPLISSSEVQFRRGQSESTLPLLNQ